MVNTHLCDYYTHLCGEDDWFLGGKRSLVERDRDARVDSGLSASSPPRHGQLVALEPRDDRQMDVVQTGHSHLGQLVLLHPTINSHDSFCRHLKLTYFLYLVDLCDIVYVAYIVCTVLFVRRC